MKLADGSAIDELITTCSYHPTLDYSLMYGTSKGIINLCDLRTNCLIERGNREAILQFNPRSVDIEFAEDDLSALTDSILDANFSPDGKYILSRDYFCIRLWDVRNNKSPVWEKPVHNYLRDQADMLYENDALLDAFQCAMSPDGRHFVTGSYSNL
jgi:serine/threonine-protein phosphatase 2A regulatory subunit B